MKRRTMKKRRSRGDATILRSYARERDSHWRIWDGTPTGEGRAAALFEIEIAWLVDGTPRPKRLTYPWLRAELAYGWHRSSSSTNTAAASSWGDSLERITLEDVTAQVDALRDEMVADPRTFEYRPVDPIATLFPPIPSTLRPDDEFTFKVDPVSWWLR